MLTIGVLERYLRIMEAGEEDCQEILARARELAEDDGEVLMGRKLPQILDGFPRLSAGLTYEMFQRIRGEDSSLLEPLRERSRRYGSHLLEDPGSPVFGRVILSHPDAVIEISLEPPPG
jgi:hypothetical protein